MGLLDLITNTIEGTAQVAVNVVKIPIGAITAPFDGGDAIVDAGEGISDGVSKIGKATPAENPQAKGKS